MDGTETQYFGSATPTEKDISYKEDTFEPGGLKKWDYGLIGSVGITYDMYMFNLNYEHGLYDVSRSGKELKNRNVSFSLGIKF